MLALKRRRVDEVLARFTINSYTKPLELLSYLIEVDTMKKLVTVWEEGVCPTGDHQQRDVTC